MSVVFEIVKYAAASSGEAGSRTYALVTTIGAPDGEEAELPPSARGSQRHGAPNEASQSNHSHRASHCDQHWRSPHARPLPRPPPEPDERWGRRDGRGGSHHERDDSEHHRTSPDSAS